jgi:hypothetical protein
MSPKQPQEVKSPFGWWIASYVVRFEWKDGSATKARGKHLAHENTILIRAKDRDQAFKKANAVGRLSSHKSWRRYGDPPGKLGRWVFEGLASLLPVYEQLTDGAEILWVEHGGLSLANIKRLVKKKSQLEAFK